MMKTGGWFVNILKKDLDPLAYIRHNTSNSICPKFEFLLTDA